MTSNAIPPEFLEPSEPSPARYHVQHPCPDSSDHEDHVYYLHMQNEGMWPWMRLSGTELRSSLDIALRKIGYQLSEEGTSRLSNNNLAVHLRQLSKIKMKNLPSKKRKELRSKWHRWAIHPHEIVKTPQDMLKDGEDELDRKAEELHSALSGPAAKPVSEKQKHYSQVQERQKYRHRQQLRYLIAT